ncbi:MAG: hypothetical protein J0H01_17645 [Rhizobiales bacterium]|nr:hypothetical protein [Hyphomicrobiales bacterium]
MGETEKAEGGANRLLKGWKEIAAFFGRDERTVRRWAEATELPVHRVPGRRRAAIYAYSSELNLWLRSRSGREALGEPGPVAPAPPPQPVSAPPVPARSWRMAGWAAALAGFLLVAGALAGWRLDLAAQRVSGDKAAAGAEQFYLDGLYNLETRTADGLIRAIGLFTQALTQDPNHALAHIGLADAYNLVSQYTTVPPGEVYPKAKAAAERAIALAPEASGGYAALAFNAYYWERNFPGAMRLFERAIALDPANARARHWYALVAMQDRRFDVALREIATAQRLDPKAPSILANKGLILFHAGRIDEALAILRPLAETEPSMLSPAAYLATIYLATGRDRDFLREFRRAAMLSRSAEDRAIADAAEAGLGDGGRQAMFSAMLAEQQRLHDAGRQPAFKLALTAAMAGDDGLAFDYLARSVQRKEQELAGIRMEPALARFRNDHRFNVIVAEAGLSPATSRQVDAVNP